jgi:2-dehydropantoate 2-reductase
MRNRVAELWPGLNAEDRMRITVIGTGGIGGPYGASLATAGADVIFVARGAHLAAICENGLRIEGDR